MKARAALFYKIGEPFQVEEIDVGEPKENEVLVKMAATGLCHSDYHLVTGEFGDLPVPMIGGHEGAGTVEQVGPGVKNLKKGDHVLMTFLPACGQCMYCAMGQSQYCDNSGGILAGMQLDGTHRAFNRDGKPCGQFCLLGTFANYAVVPHMSCIKLHPDIPLEKICLMGCGIPTGFGSATKTAGTRPGETVVVFGIGGIGANALQGAASVGARMVIAVDPVPFKREVALQFGATHSIDPKHEDVVARVLELTYNRGADRVIITIGNPVPDDIKKAFACTRKAGKMVLTSVTNGKYDSMPISPIELTLFAKNVSGTLFGDSTAREDVPRLLEMYSAGKLKVDELITRTYKLDEINAGYQDMLDGKNVRGVVIHEH